MIEKMKKKIREKKKKIEKWCVKKKFKWKSVKWSSLIFLQTKIILTLPTNIKFTVVHLKNAKRESLIGKPLSQLGGKLAIVS